MRSIQFCILMAGSIFVCLLYLEQIYLARALYQQQRVLVDSQQIASYGPSYENSWKQLATRIYQTSRQDPAMIDLLKRNQIAVQINRPAAPAQPVPVPQASSKSSTSAQSKTAVGP